MEDEDTGTAPDGAIVVRLGPGRYALPMSAVAEVGRPLLVTRVPGVPPWLAGVVNWRGRVLPVLDVRTLLGADRTDPTSTTRLVVVTDEAFSVGLVADAVEGTLLLEAELELPPTTLTGAATALLAGQVVDGAGPVGVIDVTAVLALRDALPRARRTA